MVQIIIIGVVVVIGIGVLWWGANLLLRRFALAARGCPRCHKPLVRSHRKPWQRVISKVVPGLRRYACQACGWRGMRIRSRED